MSSREPARPADGAHFELLDASDPRLAPTRDPDRSRRRLADAVWQDEQMDVARERLFTLLDEHGETLADRSTLPGHLTGSALVVDAAGERVLLLFHTKLQRWLQPGGHADGDHELAGVALREAAEETGIEGLRVMVPAIDLDIHEIPARGTDPAHDHLDLRFVVVAPADATVVGNHESEALRWVTLEELSALVDEVGLARVASRALAAFRAGFAT